MWKSKILIITLIIVILGATSGCAFFPKEDERLVPPIIETTATEYKTDTVVYGTINRNVTTFGSFKPINEIRYSFTEKGGTFSQFYFEKNDEIKVGDVIAQLDIGDLDKDLRDMEITIQKAKLNFEKSTEQYNSNLISEYDFKIARLSYLSTENRYNDLILELRNSQIIAAEDGVVSYLAPVEEGDFVSKGDIIFKIIINNDIKLTCTGSSIYKFNKNEKVVISSLNIETEGEIVTSTRNNMEVLPDEFFKEWKLGTSVMVTQNLNTVEDVLMVNQKSISDFGGKTFAKILVDGIPIEKEVVLVEVGLSDGLNIEVVSGLDEGDEAIIY